MEGAGGTPRAAIRLTLRVTSITFSTALAISARRATKRGLRTQAFAPHCASFDARIVCAKRG